jgi:hypothetical protein
MCGVLTTLLFGDDEDEVEKARDDLDDAVADYHDEHVAKVRAEHEQAKVNHGSTPPRLVRRVFTPNLRLRSACRSPDAAAPFFERNGRSRK